MKRAYENYLAGAQLTAIPIDRLRSRRGVRIPTQSGRRFRFEAGHHSDLIPATIPI